VTRVWIDRQVLAQMRVGAPDAPAIVVEEGGVRRRCRAVRILGPSEIVTEQLRPRPDPLVSAWVETEALVEDVGR
jgi:hypothetical protein